MTGRIFSTYELAREKANDRLKDVEQDIFICSCCYRSGQEFILKTRDELVRNGDFLYHLRLPFKHRFKIKENAEREAEKFASNSGKPVYVRKKTTTENGYVKILYYYLTYKAPCSI